MTGKFRSTFTVFIVTFLLMSGAAYAGSKITRNFLQPKKGSEKVLTPTTTPKPTVKPKKTPTPTLNVSMYPTRTMTPKPTVIIPTVTPNPTSQPQITVEPTKTPDTTPPTSSMYYPQTGGTITYKTDGKVCAYQAPPSDDSGSQGIESFFAFDGGSFQKGLGYFCADSLPNGQHSLSFYSKDQAGNTETPKVISFNVDIPGN